MNRLTFNMALNLTLEQYFMIYKQGRAEIGAFLGVSGQGISNRMADRSKWSAEDLAMLAMRYGVATDDLMPKPDGMGGWIPAPYVPAYAKNPTPNGVGSSEVVAGTGFEPATSGL